MNETFKIGLTGGIASGKTTVCNLFKELSIDIIDADVISHELSKKGGAAFEEIIEAFEDEGLREKVSIMVGGAPVTQEFADDMGADGYGKDAIDCVELAKELANK